MKTVDYQDRRGRWYRVLLPDSADEAEAPQGIPVGPPDVVDDLDLPEPLATRLHNELFSRHIWTVREAQRPSELVSALQAALRLDAQSLYKSYANLSKL